MIARRHASVASRHMRSISLSSALFFCSDRWSSFFDIEIIFRMNCTISSSDDVRCLGLGSISSVLELCLLKKLVNPAVFVIIISE